MDNGLGPRDWFFFIITCPRIHNETYLSLLNCRFFSVGCMHFPHVQYTILISQYAAKSGTLSFRRSLVELEDFGVTHLSNQSFDS